MRLLLGLTILILTGCSLQRNRRVPMPIMNSIEVSQSFSDSLKTSGIEKILVYHKKHGMSQREYYIFWLDTDLQLRRINETGIFKLNSWEMVGFYRGNRLFEFFDKNQRKLNHDSIPETNMSHYPYADIHVMYGDSVTDFHLPNGIQSSENSSPYQLARLVESILFNLEQRTYWEHTGKKMKYYPKNFDPTRKKWQKWQRNKIRNGEIWDDYYH